MGDNKNSTSIYGIWQGKTNPYTFNMKLIYYISTKGKYVG